MEKSRIQYVLMFPILLNIIAMVLMLFLDVYIGAKIIIDLILGVSTAILLILAWIIVVV